MHLARVLFAAALLTAAGTAIGSARALVRTLPLPAHATIDPFGSRALMAVARDGTIAATMTVNGYLTRPIVWNNGSAAFRGLDVRGSIAGFDGQDGLLLDASGPQRFFGTTLTPLDLTSCENFPQSSIGPVVAGALDNDSVIATMLSPPIVDLDDTSGQYAPVVLHLRSGQCLNMGNGVALATGGLYAAGYTAYINNVPAPSNVISAKERFVAMRWHERTREPLGPGVAVAIDASGFAAGADVPPGTGASYSMSPHARVWKTDGSVVELSPGSPVSVAYAVDGPNRVIGMLEDGDRRHHAFLWDGARLERLDDIVHASGWRFECGYAFASDGAIVGTGTFRGNASAFEITGL